MTLGVARDDAAPITTGCIDAILAQGSGPGVVKKTVCASLAFPTATFTGLVAGDYTFVVRSVPGTSTR